MKDKNRLTKLEAGFNIRDLFAQVRGLVRLLGGRNGDSIKVQKIALVNAITDKGITHDFQYGEDNGT
jgi:hypothetical protein